MGVDGVNGGVVGRAGELHGDVRGLVVLADDGGDLHAHLVAHDVTVELLPLGAPRLSRAGRGRTPG